jgi:hypothetical protein
MNFFGKILTVLVAFAAFGLMVASLFVYATHRNWKEDYDQLKSQYDAVQVQNQQLTSERDNLESQLTAEVEFTRQEAAKLATERDQLLGDNVSLQQQLDQIVQLERSTSAAVASTQANNEKLAGEVGDLRGEIRTNQSERDRAFSTAVQATDELHEANNNLTVLTQRNSQLATQVANMTNVMDANGLDPATDPGAVMPRVRGIVSAVQNAAGSQLIEITVGADDGLKPRHTVEVFRGDRYLGRAEILKTEPDRAVGRVLRQFQQGQIEEGDDVATRFRIG